MWRSLVAVGVLAGVCAMACSPRVAGAQEREEVARAVLPAEGIEVTLRSARARSFRPTGRRTIIFEMRLEGPVDAWWVPETHSDPGGWRHEIAAWRVARCLGMDNLPPAVVRSVDREALRARLDPSFADAWDDIADAIRWDEAGRARGAAVYLPRDARPSRLTRRLVLERRLRSLAQGSSDEPGRANLYADLAHAILFNYVVGRGGRFDEGSSLPGTASGRRLFVLDHARAFPARLPASRLEELRRRLLRVERLSPWFAHGVARCDARALRSRLGEGLPLLTEGQLEGLLDRRRTVLSWIVALVDAHGTERVLVLP